MIPKSKTFDVIFCLIMMFFFDSSDTGNAFIGKVAEIKSDGRIVVSSKDGVHEYFLYGLDYKKEADISGYKRYMDMIIDSDVKVVEMKKRAVVYWYKHNLNALLIRQGYFKVSDSCTDNRICDTLRTEAEEFKLQEKSANGPF